VRSVELEILEKNLADYVQLASGGETVLVTPSSCRHVR